MDTKNNVLTLLKLVPLNQFFNVLSSYEYVLSIRKKYISERKITKTNKIQLDENP